MKTTENCFGIGSYVLSVFFMGLFCVWTLFNPPLPVFVCFPRRLCAHLCFLHSLVYLSPCFLTLSYTLVFPCPPCHPALFSEASCSSPVLYLSFLVLSLTLDFGFWTLDVILSKPTFCYSTCLPASVSALVTGFIASNKRISLLWIPLLTWTAEKTRLCLNLAKRQRRCPHSRNDDIVCFRKFPQNSKCFMPLQQPQRSITVLGGTDEICSPAQASDQQIGF